MKSPKPRSTICWFCGRKLYQSRVFVEKVIDGHPRILHKSCVEDSEDSEDPLERSYNGADDHREY